MVCSANESARPHSPSFSPEKVEQGRTTRSLGGRLPAPPTHHHQLASSALFEPKKALFTDDCIIVWANIQHNGVTWGMTGQGTARRWGTTSQQLGAFCLPPSLSLSLCIYSWKLTGTLSSSLGVGGMLRFPVEAGQGDQGCLAGPNLNGRGRGAGGEEAREGFSSLLWRPALCRPPTYYKCLFGIFFILKIPFMFIHTLRPDPKCSQVPIYPATAQKRPCLWRQPVSLLCLPSIFFTSANDPLAWNVSSIFCLGARAKSAMAFCILSGTGLFTLDSATYNTYMMMRVTLGVDTGYAYQR